MIVLVTIQTVVLVILSVLVVGLLRGYATVLNRLHELDGGGSDAAPTPFRTIPEVPEPAVRRIEGRGEWAPAHDINGVGLGGEIVTVRTVGVDHDTIIAFLSSGCDGCTGFWEELAHPNSWALPTRGRVLVVTKSADEESLSLLSELCAPGVDLVMSSEAWKNFEVPGSPFVVVVDGHTGRIKGEGSGTSFSQVGGLIEQAIRDGNHRGSVIKPAADRERELDVDRVLFAAGIRPGDPSLYPAAEPGDHQVGNP
jgi:hypothetical protein